MSYKKPKKEFIRKADFVEIDGFGLGFWANYDCRYITPLLNKQKHERRFWR